MSRRHRWGRREYSGWGEVKDAISLAFKELRKKGYFCRQNFQCCQSCGWAAVPEDKKEKVLFYHHQDLDGLKQQGTLYLAWCGDAGEVKEVLEKYLTVKWDGSESTRPQVSKKEVVVEPKFLAEAI